MSDDAQRKQAEALLSQLGQSLAENYDDAIEAALSLHDGEGTLGARWGRYISKFADQKLRTRKLIQLALEELLHDTLFSLQEQRKFRIQGKTESGDWLQIDDFSDGIHGDLFDWLQSYSKNSCVTMDLVNTD